MGVVGDIVKSFHDQKSDIVGTDYDEIIVGTKMFDDVEIYHGERTLALFGGCGSGHCDRYDHYDSDHRFDPGGLPHA